MTRRIALEVNREVQTVNVMQDWQPDPAWNFTDANGHLHSFDEGHVPTTIEWVITNSYYCHECHDTHDEGEYRCKECGDVVEPHWRNHGPSVMNIPGLTTYTLKVEGFDSWEISKEQFDELQAAVKSGDSLEEAVEKLMSIWGYWQ